MRAVAYASLIVTLLGAGCAREHLAAGFGRATRDTLTMQAPPAGKPAPPPNMRLDTQEAEVISDNYIRGLAGRAKTEPEPVLYVAPQRQQMQPAMPPPSVPRS